MKNKMLRTILPLLLAGAIIVSGLLIPQQLLKYRETLLLDASGPVRTDTLTIFDGGTAGSRVLENRISQLSDLVQDYARSEKQNSILLSNTREPLDMELTRESAIEAAQLLQTQLHQKFTTWLKTPNDSGMSQSDGKEPPAVDTVEFLVSPFDASLSLWYADTGACRMAFDALSGVPVYFSTDLEAMLPAESGYWTSEHFCLLASEIYDTYQADGQYFTFPLTVTTVSPVISPVDGSKEYTYEFTSAQYLLSVSVSQDAAGIFTKMEGWLTTD